MYPHTKFGIPTSKNIGDMDRTRKPDGRTDGRTVRLLYATQSSFGGIKSEFDQIHTTDQPRTLRKIYRSRTATRQQENSESEVSSWDASKTKKDYTDKDNTGKKTQTYQIVRLYCLVVNYHVFPIEAYVKPVSPRVRPFLDPMASFEQYW